ncbi:hypothetical protein Agub_g13758 [Astrephomene gubernaculifera]|uniref:TIR domain-containing protein n=1 Tax=Astrephomene gubernaculifera TaxID=47775 RepID=A0AAD3E2C9_9CHLO|nr:hypothetical protein Agub_g13758 [Astrephomene gubernaculifera]
MEVVIHRGFLSYKRGGRDERIARRLYDTFRNNGVNMFSDFGDLHTGVGFEDQIREACENSAVFVCILSIRYVQSYWCIQELLFARMAERRILPIFIDEAGDVSRALPAAEIAARLRSSGWEPMTGNTVRSAYNSAASVQALLMTGDDDGPMQRFAAPALDIIQEESSSCMWRMWDHNPSYRSLLDDMNSRFLCCVNSLRQEEDDHELIADVRLIRAAMRRAEALMAGQAGGGFDSYLRAAGVGYRSAKEHRGYNHDLDGVMEHTGQSTLHHMYTHIGWGVRSTNGGRHYWVVLLVEAL